MPSPRRRRGTAPSVDRLDTELDRSDVRRVLDRGLDEVHEDLPHAVFVRGDWPNRVGSRHTLQAQRHPDGVERWREVHPRYVERFGPEASTNGPPEGHPVND